MSTEISDTLLVREAAQAPDLVAAMLARNAGLCREIGARLRRQPPRFVITGARGSSDSAATYVKYLAEVHLGKIAASLGPSVVSIYNAAPDFAGCLFVTVSQSGQSPDLLRLAEAAARGGAVTIAIANDPASPLARASEYVLPLGVGRETGVAATKSYIASVAAGLQLAASWSGRADLLAAVERLPAVLHRALGQDWSAAADAIGAAENVYVVGRGPGLAAAQEMALKLKETAGLHAEAYSAAELMHGPVTMVGTDFPVILIGQDDEALPGLQELARWLVARGMRPVAIGPAAIEGTLALPLEEGLPPSIAPIAAIQSFYALAGHVAARRGRNPDEPRYLRKVTETT